MILTVLHLEKIIAIITYITIYLIDFAV